VPLLAKKKKKKDFIVGQERKNVTEGTQGESPSSRKEKDSAFFCRGKGTRGRKEECHLGG